MKMVERTVPGLQTNDSFRDFVGLPTNGLVHDQSPVDFFRRSNVDYIKSEPNKALVPILGVHCDVR